MALSPNNPPKILIVAGEASGDDHAARLVAAIREFCPEAEFFGVGGEAMAAQGVRILCPASELAVVGLLEVVGHLPAIWRALRGIGRVLKTARPDLVILVDFPDFNFWVARLAKYYRVPVMYYISPQVWAWRTYRVRTLARLTDRLVVIFPFEADFYREQGVPVDYVGHPFRETLPPLADRRAFFWSNGPGPGGPHHRPAPRQPGRRNRAAPAHHAQGRRPHPPGHPRNPVHPAPGLHRPGGAGGGDGGEFWGRGRGAAALSPNPLPTPYGVGGS